MIFLWTPNKLFKDYVLNNAQNWSHLGCYDKRNTLLHWFHGDFFIFLSHKKKCCHASAEQYHRQTRQERHMSLSPCVTMYIMNFCHQILRLQIRFEENRYVNVFPQYPKWWTKYMFHFLFKIAHDYAIIQCMNFVSPRLYFQKCTVASLISPAHIQPIHQNFQESGRCHIHITE